MKKSSLALVLSAAILLSGCSVFGKLSEVEYNNQVVDAINQSSGIIEETATLYNDTVPDVVSEKDTIDVTTMQSTYNDASDALKTIDSVANLESRNIEQQNAVQTGISTYQSAAEQYLQTYNDMLVYYGQNEYQKDVSKVQTIDENLHTSYTTFIQANNDLVDTLDSFVNADTEAPAGN